MNNVIKKVFNVYAFLFIFTMINREFLFFGIDLRYVGIVIAVILILYKLIAKNFILIKSKDDDSKDFKKLERYIVLFFAVVFLSNIAWFWNGLTINQEQFTKLIILYIYNFLSFIVFINYKKIVDFKKIYKFIIFSCIVLSISFLLIGQGYTLSEISGSNAKYISTGGEHYNLFGDNYRIAGYAEDANYATLFFIIGIVSLIKTGKKRLILKLLLGLAFLFGIAFSFSRTLVIACIAGLLYMFFKKIVRNNKIINRINLMIIVILMVFVFILPKINILDDLTTIDTRYMMWDIAEDLFMKNPILGNGLTSFRSSINNAYNDNWYVQSHSTYWQVLSENGIIAFILLQFILYKCLNRKKNDINFLVLVFLIYAMTYETVYLQVWIFILYILQLSEGSENVKEEVDNNEKSLILS